MKVKISPGNTKMGSIPSISLPSVVTCRKDAPCFKKCYARKIERLRAPVRNSYSNNLKVLKEDPNTYWREVEATVMMSKFFRFHVSGDIPDIEYLDRMIGIAKRNQHCQILCFTKQYEIVNTLLDNLDEFEMKLPDNLHLILSAWRGLDMCNPHNLPEAHVKYKDGTTTARRDASVCRGNCTECAKADGGCWSLKNGQQVLLKEH